MSKDITRRRFLSTTGRAGIMLGMGAALPWQLENAVAAETAAPAVDLAVVKGPNSRAVGLAIEMLGGIGRFVKKGDRVVLKPNMSFPNAPDMGTTTSPDVVQKVAHLCQEAGASQVLVVDYTLRRSELCLARSGIEEACKGIPKTHVMALMDQKFYSEVPVPKGKVLRKVEIMKEVLKADVLINLPTAKSHSSSGVSLSMKNLMGVIWDRRYFHKKVDLNQAIADLSTVIKPDLIILDASRVLTDGGPGGPGTVESHETIVAGVDPVAVDAYGVGITKWYGKDFSAQQVKHILYAHELGIGEIDTAKLKVEQVVIS